jgi:hypothetical protein
MCLCTHTHARIHMYVYVFIRAHRICMHTHVHASHLSLIAFTMASLVSSAIVLSTHMSKFYHKLKVYTCAAAQQDCDCKARYAVWNLEKPLQKTLCQKTTEVPCIHISRSGAGMNQSYSEEHVPGLVLMDD